MRTIGVVLVIFLKFKMSILIPLEGDDIKNTLEIQAGQYYYDAKHHNIINATDATPLYVGDSAFITDETWMNQFIVNPMTRVSVYDINQAVKGYEYTGNVLVINNYNNKKVNRQLIDLTSYQYVHIFGSNVAYIVIEPIDSQRCKSNVKRYTNGTQITFISSNNHKFKRIDEPIIRSQTSMFTHNPGIKLIEIVVVLLILAAFFAFSSTYVINNGLPKFIINKLQK